MMNKIKVFIEKIMKNWDIKYFMKNKKNRIFIYGIGGIITVLFILFILPYIISWFIPISEADKKIIKKIEIKIKKFDKQYIEKEKFFDKINKENEQDKEKLLKINQGLLQTQINLYKFKYNKYPSAKIIKRVIKYRLIEPYSYSSKIYTTENKRGGWYYNFKEGKIYPNG